MKLALALKLAPQIVDASHRGTREVPKDLAGQAEAVMRALRKNASAMPDSATGLVVAHNYRVLAREVERAAFPWRG